MTNWQKRLLNSNKGIWGIEYPLGSFFDAEHFVKSSPTNCETAVIFVLKDRESLKFCDSNQEILKLDFPEIVKSISVLAKENDRQSLRIYICNFQNADISEQCALIKTARCIQESMSSQTCQFVFCGNWSYYAFCSAHRKIHGHTNSPPAQSKDILHVPPWGTDDVLNVLHEERLMAANPTEIDLVACDFLLEQTDGDEFLIRQAINHLVEQNGKWPSDIEQVLSELISAPDVISEIAKRINSLAPLAKAELTKLLRVHNLVRQYDSIDSEQLWLAGLVRCQKLDGGKQCIQIAGSLINTVVRNILENENPGSVATPNYLCFEREAISTAAYRRVSKIENMFRNLIVSEFYAEKGDKWHEKLNGIKTKSREWEEQEDLIKLVMIHVNSRLGIDTESNRTETTSPAVSSVRPQQETILDSAQKWQKRQRDSHSFELTNDNLMHFLTTESIVNILVNRKSCFYGEGRLFNKEDLQSALGDYIVIRAAVAHNQPIKLSTISRLDDLQRKFIVWLTVFADQIVVHDQDQHLVRDA